jgi:hypothetical protein
VPGFEIIAKGSNLKLVVTLFGELGNRVPLVRTGCARSHAVH